MEEKKAEKKFDLNDSIMEANKLLMDNPLAANINLKKLPTGKFMYGWDDVSAKAVGARKTLRNELKRGYGSGAYNYEQIAQKLRLPVLSITALIDDEFRREQGL